LGANDAIAAGTVLNHDWLLPHHAQLMRRPVRERIKTEAGRKWRYEPNKLGRIASLRTRVV